MVKKLLHLAALTLLMAVPLSLRAQCPDGQSSCSFSIECTDSYGDGWNGAYIEVFQGTTSLGSTNHTTGAFAAFDFTGCLSSDSNIYFIWHSGSYDDETSFVIYNGDGSVVISAYGDDYYTGDTIARMALVCPTCIKPSGVTLDAATVSSLTVSWTANSGESVWQIMIGDSLIENVTSNPYTIEDLPSSSAFGVSVRSLCGGDDTSAWSAAVTMRTACASVTILPWHDGFSSDQSDTYPMCWNLIDTLVFEQFDYSTYSMNTVKYPVVVDGYGEPNYLYMYYDGYENETAFITSPYFELDDLNALHFTFEAYDINLGSNNRAEFGIITDTSDLSTFVPMVSVNSNNSYEWRTYEFYTDTISSLASAEGLFFAFRFQASEYSYCFLRNVNVAAASGCRQPALNSGSVDSLSYDAVALSWGAEEVDSYLVRLTDVYDVVTLHPAEADSLVITGLTPDTYYTAEVASICGDDTTEYTFIANFTTQLRCYSLASASTSALTANAATLTWSYTENMGIEHAGVYIEVVDQDSAAAPVLTAFAAGTSYTFTGLATNHRYQATIHTLCGEEDSYDTAMANTVSFMPEVPPCVELAGNTSSNYVPLYGSYNYGYTQSLYDNALVSGVDTLTGISFQNTTTSNQTRTVDIYLGYTNLSTLSNSNYVPATDLTLVAQDATIDPSTTGWHTIVFDTAFATQDSGNLVLAVVNKTGSWNGVSWAAVDNTGLNSVYWYSDYSTSTPESPAGSSWYQSQVPAVRFQGNCSSDCIAPSFGVVSLETTSAVVEWLAGGDETSWTLQYREAGATEWTSIASINASPYTITDLTPGTSYQLRMGSECGSDTVFGSPISFVTVCSSVHVPFSAIFNVNTIECWDILGYASSSIGAINLYGSYYVVTPEIADSMNAIQVRINARSYSDAPSTTQYMMVGACNADQSAIQWIDTVALTNEFADYVVYFSGYTGNLNHVIVRHTNSSDTYLHSVSVEPLADCMPVSEAVLDSVATTTVSLSWASDAEDFVLVYKSLDDSAATWQTVLTGDTTYSVTGLTPGTRYTFGVAVVCGGETSDTIFLSVNTDCVPATVPYSQVLGGALPICWNNNTIGNIGTSWNQSAGYDIDYIYSVAPYGASAANDWLITASVAIPSDAATNNVQLVYGTAGYADSYYPTSEAILEVYASTTGSDIANFIDTLAIDTLTANGAVLEYHRVSLAAYAGQTVRFAFRNVSRMSGQVFLTDVNVRSTNTPLYIVYGNTMAFTHDTVEYIAERQEGELNGMNLVWYSSMAAAGHATILNNGTDTMHIVYTADGIDSLSFTATNSFGADTITWLNEVRDCGAITEFPWTVDFENSGDIYCWRQEGNSRWEIGTGDYSSTTGSHAGTGNALIIHENNGYVTKLITPVLDLSGSSSASLSFWHLQRSWSGDIDQLNIYYRTSQSAEWVSLASYTAAIESWTLDSVTLPNTTATYQVAFEMIDNYGYGIALDDITINGVGAPLCAAPANLIATADETTATISFIGEGGSYEVAIAENWDETTVTPVAITDTFYTFTGLTAATTYTVGVRSVCSTTNMSEWVTVAVTTDEHPCFTPSNLTVSDVTLTSATLGWTLGEAESEWQLHVTGTNYDSTIIVTTNPYTLTGLTSATDYSFTVTALCSETQQSDASEAHPFTTLTCQPVTGLHSSNVSSNGATISWTAPTGVNSFELVYGLSGFSQTAGTTVAVTGTSYTLTGLEAGTVYDVLVRSVCATGVYSEWTDRVNFETEADQQGIEDVNNANIALFPNPATTTVTLTGIDGQATVTVVDMNGRENGKWNVENGKITIDLTGYAQGAYFVRITGEQLSAIRKLIVK